MNEDDLIKLLQDMGAELLGNGQYWVRLADGKQCYFGKGEASVGEGWPETSWYCQVWSPYNLIGQTRILK